MIASEGGNTSQRCQRSRSTLRIGEFTYDLTIFFYGFIRLVGLLVSISHIKMGIGHQFLIIGDIQILLELFDGSLVITGLHHIISLSKAQPIGHGGIGIVLHKLFQHFGALIFFSGGKLGILNAISSLNDILAVGIFFHHHFISCYSLLIITGIIVGISNIVLSTGRPAGTGI